MNQLARIQIRYGVAYYRRVFRQAVREASQPWGGRLAVTAIIAALSFIASWSLTASGVGRLLYSLAGIIGFWLLVVARYVIRAGRARKRARTSSMRFA